jgi:hypothetical protein
MEKNMAAEVEIQGPLDAEISAQKTLNVLPVVWDDDIMTYDGMSHRAMIVSAEKRECH